jgi:hypothetical protein
VQRRETTTYNLPKEIWKYIAEFLPAKALISLCHSSTEMKEYADAAIILFINHQLSHFDYEEARKFLLWYWQTDHYEALKNKLIQHQEMRVDEVCCLAIARNRDIPIEAFHEKLPSAIAMIKAELNEITIKHLALIETALAVSMFVIHANRNDKSNNHMVSNNALYSSLQDQLWHRELIREINEEKTGIPCKHTFLNLSNIVLAGANLGLIMLHGACLDGADLSRCLLNSNMKIDHASLRYANLTAAHLTGGTCLEHCDLFMATLNNSMLFSTRLNGATFFSRPVHDLLQLENELKQIILNIDGAKYIKDVWNEDYTNELYIAIVTDLISRLNEMNKATPEEKAAFIDNVAPLLGYEGGGLIGFFRSPLPSHLILLFNAQRNLLVEQKKLESDQYTKPNCYLQ